MRNETKLTQLKIDIPEEEFNKASNVNESVAMVEQWIAANNGNAAVA